MANTFLKFSPFIRRNDTKLLRSSLAWIMKQSMGTKPSTKIHGHAKFVKEKLMRKALILEKCFKDLIKEKKWYSVAEWNSIQSEALNRHYISVEDAFTATVMKTFQSKHDLVTAKSLISYCKHKHLTPNVATWTFFLKLCAKFDEADNEQLILNAYEDLKSIDFAHNGDVLNTCFCALAKTKQWQKCIELMTIFKQEKEQLWDVSYNAFILAAFRNKAFDIGYEYLKFFKPLNNDVIVEWLNLCNDDKSIATVFKFVDYLATLRVTVPFNISDKIQSCFETKNYVAKYVNITPEGFCTHCHTRLNNCELSIKDFESLRDAVLDSIIKGSDVYLKSNPVELRSFENFIKKTGPHGIVVDGLNVAYCENEYKNKHSLSAQLVRVLKELKNKYKMDILVLGKQQIYKWPASAKFQIKQLGHLFLTETLSEDDTFLLYGTLVNGPNTLFISNDFMRDHKYCLKDERLNRLFRDWQWSHQIYYVINEEGDVEFLPPTTYKLCAQRSDSAIHIPCSADEPILTRIEYMLPEKWLCCNKIS